MGDDTLKREAFRFIGHLWNALLLGAYVALTSIPAVAVANGTVDIKTSIIVGSFTGGGSMIRYLLDVAGVNVNSHAPNTD